MLSRGLLRRGFQRTSRAQQQMRNFVTAAAKVEDEILSTREKAKPTCWNCHQATACCSFFCKTCDSIQPIHKSCHCDYFDMFEIPKNFKLDQRSIEKTYWNLQKRLHPDVYGSKSEFEKELSATNAAVINDAYKMLKKPNTRVKYLLALHGIDALSEGASTAVDPELLIKTMEIRYGRQIAGYVAFLKLTAVDPIVRERIAAAPSVDMLEEIRKEISDDIDAVIKRLGEVYDQDRNLESTKQYAVELQYLVKCVEEIDLKEEKLDERQ
ncbi:hypothetical protein PsorP6_001215 [Peronosclerospora sorghi]|uniref:Uncharacterized protein n=1 Tax=Peronosclerospora sorghi TaxID=230839 RepID=A0ACC0WXJ3_9STRA|nr:hypothetical protein PsorP6_001215 [Peronosclerospora sorghi]